jgi:hypothetical protein
MTYGAKRNEVRASECLRLASRATDPIVRLALHRLHREFLDAAARDETSAPVN